MFWASQAAQIRKLLGGLLKLWTKTLNKSAGKNKEANIKNCFAYTRKSHFCHRKFAFSFSDLIVSIFMVTNTKFLISMFNYINYKLILIHYCWCRDERMSYKKQYQGKLQLLATDRMDFCLGASPNQKLTSKEFKRGAFLPCKRHTNQVSFLIS